MPLIALIVCLGIKAINTVDYFILKAALGG